MRDEIQKPFKVNLGTQTRKTKALMNIQQFH